jgi:Cdc6-like AAA superfamily ATPase
MSLEPFYAEIARFLRRPNSEVLVISGKWGVGKTFAWNKLLSEARDEDRIALHKYAYVSLFGLAGLDAVNGAIFQNTVGKERAGLTPDMKSLAATVKSVKTSWRSGIKLARYIPGVSDYSEALEKLGAFSIRNQIVCIDDVERRSSSLEIRDILGLVSFLKEQRTCKVVILLNDEKLGDDYEEFRMQLEKVADSAVVFQPTPSEAAEIGIDGSTPFSEQLKKDVVALGIVNIRTIKKIESTARRLAEDLSKFDARVLEQAVHSATLFTFVKLQPDTAPSADFLRTYNQFEGLLAGGEKPLPHPEWRASLQEFGWSSTDAFDLVIADGVDKGHFDATDLEREARKLQAQFESSDNERAFSLAWEAYHDSFADNAAEVMDGLAQAIRETPNVVSPTNLSGTIGLLKELRWSGDTQALIDGYVQARIADREFWDLSESVFGDEVKDPDVRAAFAAKLATFEDDRDFAGTLIKIARERGWNSEDLIFLANQDVDVYYQTFMSLKGDELRRTDVSRCRQCGQGNEGDHGSCGRSAATHRGRKPDQPPQGAPEGHRNAPAR